MEVESRITGVTLYARGARVRRVTSLAAPPRLRIVGLPAAVIDDRCGPAPAELPDPPPRRARGPVKSQRGVVGA